MKLKLRPSDFQVREVLRDGYLTDGGEYRVYRVTKRKLTSPEAAGVLAAAAGVEVAQVSMAGLKDRQGVTVQYMSVPGGKPVEVVDPQLRIEPVGRAERALESTDSEGNAFDITIRALTGGELAALRTNLDVVRDVGVPNYFDDQRFGNLRYHQGWIARDLMLGRAEDALRRLLTARADHEQADDARFKSGLEEAWGDWERCLSYARSRGQHRSLFEHLVERPNDFTGAFRYVATRIRLIHLFAWQSHLFNRALAELVRRATPLDERVVLPSLDGPLVCPSRSWPAELPRDLLLPGAGLEEVADAAEFDLYRDLLAEEGVTPGQHRIEGVEGFALKAERRPLRVVPGHLRVRPAEPDRENPGRKLVRVRFELPRGAYASLVVKRLVGGGFEEDAPYAAGQRSADHRARHRGARRGGQATGHGQRRSFGGRAQGRPGGHWRGHDSPAPWRERDDDRARPFERRDGGRGGHGSERGERRGEGPAPGRSHRAPGGGGQGRDGERGTRYDDRGRSGGARASDDRPWYGHGGRGRGPQDRGHHARDGRDRDERAGRGAERGERRYGGQDRGPRDGRPDDRGHGGQGGHRGSGARQGGPNSGGRPFHGRGGGDHRGQHGRGRDDRGDQGRARGERGHQDRRHQDRARDDRGRADQDRDDRRS